MKIYIIQKEPPKVCYTYEEAREYARLKLKDIKKVVIKEYVETNTITVEKC